jgi:glycosyltransferase involved in cell wall biosynthesis
METISIIIPVTFADYPHSATHKAAKFERALRMLERQTITPDEVIIIVDGCEEALKATKEATEHFNTLPIKWTNIVHKSRWAGKPRNEGINISLSKWIVYLDADDYYLENYIETLKAELKDSPCDWHVVNHYEYSLDGKDLVKRYPLIEKHGSCGTANIIHRRSMSARWPDTSNYSGDDWGFINALKKESKNYSKLNTSGYVIAHIPHKYDR